MSILDDLKSAGQLAVYYDFRSGTFLDLGGRGNSGTATNIARSPRPWLDVRPIGVVTSAAALPADSYSCCILLGSRHYAPSAVVYFVYVDATHYVSFSSGGLLAVYGGVAVRSSGSVVGANCVSWNHATGTTGAVYKNGSLLGAFDGNLDAVSLAAGTKYFFNGSGGGSPLPYGIKAFVITSTVLSATQHAQLYADLENRDRKWPIRPYLVRAVEAAPNQAESGLLASWDFSAGATIPDASGNGKTLTGSNVRQQGPVGLATKLTANNYLSGAFTTLPNGADCSIEGVVYLPTIAANNPILINFNSVVGANNSQFMLVNSSTDIHFQLWNAVNLYKRWYVDVTHHSKWLHFAFTYVHATGVTVLYLNGVAVGTYANTVAVDALSAASTYLGRRSDALAASLAQNEQIRYCKVHNSTKSADQVKQLYERSGLRDISDSYSWGIPVSTASRGGIAASYLENTKWQFRDTSGRWKVVTDTIRGQPVKALLQTTGLIAGEYGGLSHVFGTPGFTPQQRAYGTYEWSMYCASRADIRLFAPICTATTLAGGNTDSFRFTATNGIDLYVNGLTLAMRTADDYVAAGNWYQLRLTRTYANVYTLWILGGAYTKWTLVTVTSGSNPYTLGVAGVTASVGWMAHTVAAAPAANLWSLGTTSGEYSILWKPFI